MCRECNHRRWQKKLDMYSRLSKEYGFVDEYDNGFGWWSNPEKQARIQSRHEAWRALGMHTAGLSNYSFTPSVAKSIGDDLAMLPYLGMTTVKKLEMVTEADNEKFNNVYESLYNNLDSWVWNYVRSNFKRVKGR